MVYHALTVAPESRLFADAAARHALPLSLVLGVVERESSFRVAAWNPEPPYQYFWDVARRKPFRALTAQEITSEVPPEDFPAPEGVPLDAEWWGQQASWGLMQVMGGVARELGYDGHWLTEILTDTVLAVDLGCRHLQRKLRRYGPDLAPVVAAYNAGSPRRRVDGRFRNQAYVDEVLAATERWRAKLGGTG